MIMYVAISYSYIAHTRQLSYISGWFTARACVTIAGQPGALGGVDENIDRS